jgi:hypothetical protein
VRFDARKAWLLGLGSLGALAVAACSNIVGLSGYDFESADASTSADGSTPSDASGGDGASKDAAADATSCSLQLTGFTKECKKCVENNCCEVVQACLNSSGCETKLRTGTLCSTDRECKAAATCSTKNACACGT